MTHTSVTEEFLTEARAKARRGIVEPTLEQVPATLAEVLARLSALELAVKGPQGHFNTATQKREFNLD